MTPGGTGAQVAARPRGGPHGAASVAPAAHPRAALARWETAAFLAALLVYAITRFWRLGEYPLFFFTDEALEPLMAEQLIAHGFRDAAGRLFPVYFENGGAWAPVLPVYAHVISLSLFGKSVEVARGTAAFVTLLGAGAVGLLLKSVFRTPWWWTGPLILATTPAWFLHSRTTFETVFMVSAYAGFLLCYLLYRVRSPWFLYPAILCAGATFYSYTNGQAVIGLTALLLAVVDAPYHLRRWRYVLPGIALAAVVAVPLLVFQRAQPDATAGQLTRVSSYLFERLPLGEKARRFAVEYGRGLSPAYWFFSPPDLSRHVMGPHPHLRTAMLPFVVLGVLVCLRRLRQAPYRTVLIAALAAPIGASLAAIAITRVLAFVVPATVLAVLGLSAVFGLLHRRSLRLGAGVLTFAILAGSSLGLLREALTDGPRWDRNYGLYGQQWGAVQLFGVIPEILRAEPRTRILLSPTWANGTDLLPRFFLQAGSPQAARVTTANATGYLGRRQELTPDMLFILTPAEYEEVRSSPKLAAVELQRTLAYPDGQPGFYFVRLAYVPDVDAIFAAEREARRVLVEGTAVVGGEALSVRHSRLDIGRPGDLFDGEARTLVRFMEENPAVLELRFARPRRIARVDLLLTAGDWEVTARLNPDAAAADARRTVTTTRSARTDTQVELVVAATPQDAPEVDALRLEIRLRNVSESPKIHLREVQLR